MKITFLGTGTSMGVPTIGCRCAVCCSRDPRNLRTRASLLIGLGERRFLIDTSPDLRAQCIREGLRRIDAVFFTHSHADHILGLDDLRPFSLHGNPASIPCFGSKETIENVSRTFYYIFSEPQPGGSLPRVDLKVIDPGSTVNGLPVRVIPILHGGLSIYAYRVGDLAYITDCSEIPAESYTMLRGTRVLILGVLRHVPHPTHLNVDKALRIIKRVQPEKTFFTHISHEMDHEQANAELPESVRLAYDGLCFEIEDP